MILLTKIPLFQKLCVPIYFATGEEVALRTLRKYATEHFCSTIESQNSLFRENPKVISAEIRATHMIEPCLANQNLAEIELSAIIETLFYDHPSIGKRLRHAEQFAKK